MPSSCEGSFIGGQKVLPKDFADKIGSDMGQKGASVEKKRRRAPPCAPSVRLEKLLKLKVGFPNRNVFFWPFPKLGGGYNLEPLPSQMCAEV